MYLPAGTNPLVVLLGAGQAHLSWDFLLFPMLSGAVMLVLIVCVVNNIYSVQRYPYYW